MEIDRKVLIITYYWPPSGGSGVQRWLKFVKYLPGFGWKPFVFTPENPSFSVRDESLLKNVPPEAEIIRFPIWEPYGLFQKMSAVAGESKAITPTALVSVEKKSVFQKLSTWIRGNVIIPDPRVFWVRPSVKFLDQYITQHNIRTIITTGPPHSVHLIGYRLKKKNSSIQWFADFRDPWSEWGFLDSLMVGGLARNLHKRLEAKVLKTADKVITITPFYVRQFERLSGRKVTLLTNGFDEEDFRNLKVRSTKQFVIRHVGTVNEKCDPRPFMLAVESLAEDDELFRRNVRIDFVGEVHPDFIAYLRQSSIMNEVTSISQPVPHNKLIGLYENSSLLVLILTGYKDAEGYMPGKLFEYIATGLPIVATGPEDGDAANLLREAGAGDMVDGNNKEKIKEILLAHFRKWQQGSVTKPSTSAEQYSRKTITKQLTEML